MILIVMIFIECDNSLENSTFIVTYLANSSSGGTVPIDNNRYAPGMTVTVLGNTENLVKSDFSFSGWNTEANGSGTNYKIGTTFTMGSSDVKLYAEWTADVTDIDGNIYKTVRIGDQIWMAENLRTTKYNDNSAIPHITDGDEWESCTTGTDAYCYFHNTIDTDSIIKF